MKTIHRSSIFPLFLLLFVFLYLGEARAADPALSLTLGPEQGGKVTANLAITGEVAGAESFSLELHFASGTVLQLPASDWFNRGAAYFPSTLFGPAPQVELNNLFKSATQNKLYINGFKPNGATGLIGGVTFNVNPAALVGDIHVLSLTGVYFSATEQTVKTFLPQSVTFTKGGCPAPGTPSSPSPASGATGVSTSPTLTWTASGADSYDIYFGTAANPPLAATGTAPSYTPGVLNSNTTYYWKIVARNACGQSTEGPVWSFTTACTPPSVPSSPSPANGATGISTSPTLTWTAAGADSFDVYFGTAVSPPLVTNTTNTNYNPTGLTGGSTYYWKIVTKNNCGQSTAGPVWSFTTKPDAGEGVITFGVFLNDIAYSTLDWGWKPNATDNFDTGIDALGPPASPDGDDAYFLSITGEPSPRDKLAKDFRPVTGDAKTWKLVLKIADGKTMKLQWDRQTLPAGWTFTIQESNTSWAGTGTVVNLNSTPPEIILDNQTGDSLTRRYLLRASQGFRLALKSGGWNLISIPLEPVDPSIGAVFGTNLLAIYEWDAAGKRYVVPTAIQAKKGFWVAVNQDANLEILGTLPASTGVHLLTGWNLVGPVETEACPSGDPVLAVYGWGWPPNYQYVLPTQCEEGKGYWIAAGQEGDVW